MKKSFQVLLCLAYVASCGGNDLPAPAPPPAPTPPTASEKLAVDLQGLTLEDFYFESFKALISRSPERVVLLASLNRIKGSRVENRVLQAQKRFCVETFSALEEHGFQRDFL